MSEVQAPGHRASTDNHATDPSSKRLFVPMQENRSSDSRRWWTVQRGPGPILATAIHDGHELRAEVARRMKLPDADRLREEDPFTGQAIVDVPTHVIAHRSRFEFDLNRGARRSGLSDCRAMLGAGGVERAACARRWSSARSPSTRPITRCSAQLLDESRQSTDASS